MTREILEELKRIAEKEKIPVMLPDGLSYCLELVKERKITSVLEIGTAIGLWSLSIAQAFPTVKIDTVELNKRRYDIANDAIKTSGFEDRIRVFHQDAKDFESNNQYDLIFLDGPKSQHRALFKRFLPNLSPKGCFLIDNIGFHGLKEQRHALDHRPNLRQMMTKIEAFRAEIQAHPDFISMDISIGDGLLLIWRKYQ